jgi:ribonucleoside-diphosphate reductase beta chain
VSVNILEAVRFYVSFACSFAFAERKVMEVVLRDALSTLNNFISFHNIIKHHTRLIHNGTNNMRIRARMNCLRKRPCLKKQLYLTIVSVNILEAVRFYVSFACSFAFAERKVMEGNAKIIKMIARDEALHLSGTQHILNLMREGKDDLEMQKIAKECESEVITMFKEACEQEKDWAEYFSHKNALPQEY